MFVPRAEQYRDRLAISILEGLQEIGRPTEPLQEEVMLLPSLEDRRDDLVGGHVPGVPAGQRVARMPGEGHHAAPGRMGHGRTAHQVEGNTVQVGFPAHLDAAQVKTHDGRESTGHRLDIRAFERIVFDILNFPGMAVHQVILMAVQDLAGLDDVEQLRHQAVLRGLHRFHFFIPAGGQGNGRSRRQEDDR